MGPFPAAWPRRTSTSRSRSTCTSSACTCCRRSITCRAKLCCDDRARLRARRAAAGRQRTGPGAAGERMSFEYHEPTSLAEAVDQGARFGADGRFLAGGTDLIIQMRRGKLSPRHVVSLHRVPDLDRVSVNGTVTLGGLVTHRALERHPAFQ